LAPNGGAGGKENRSNNQGDLVGRHLTSSQSMHLESSDNENNKFGADNFLAGEMGEEGIRGDEDQDEELSYYAL